MNAPTLTETAAAGLGAVRWFTQRSTSCGEGCHVSTVRLPDGRYESAVWRDTEALPMAELISRDEAQALNVHDALVQAVLVGRTATRGYLVCVEDGAILDIDSGWQTRHDAEQQAASVHGGFVLPVALQGRRA